MAFPFTLRQPLTAAMKHLQQSTVDYMELMRLHCKENGINILELFEEDDEFKIGSVPEDAFTYLIRKKFNGLTGFSTHKVRAITNFFKVPDGSIWYARLHVWMTSDDSVLDQIRKSPFNLYPEKLTVKKSSSAAFPSAQLSNSPDSLSGSTPPSRTGTHSTQQQGPSLPLSFGSIPAATTITSPGLNTGLSSTAKDVPTSNEGLVSTAAPPPPSGTANVVVSPSTPGAPANCGASSFGCTSTPAVGTPTEAAGPALPAFTHGLSQESTKTVTKILGSSPSVQQNQSAMPAQQMAQGSSGFGGATSSVGLGSSGFVFGGSAEAMMGTTASSNGSSSETRGSGMDALGSGDHTKVEGKSVLKADIDLE